MTQQTLVYPIIRRAGTSPVTRLLTKRPRPARTRSTMTRRPHMALEERRRAQNEMFAQPSAHWRPILTAMQRV